MKMKKILLVEDNPDDVDLTLRALKKNNILNEVIVVNDGEQALNYLECKGRFKDSDPGCLPAVVLLDLKLPKVDGHEILRAIRENPRTKFVPVVILTSSLEEEDIIKGYKYGANSYIRKPVDFQQFSTAVQNLGLYWLLLNETVPNGVKV